MPALLAHVEAFLAAAGALAQHAELPHQRWDVDEGVVIRLEDEARIIVVHGVLEYEQCLQQDGLVGRLPAMGHNCLHLDLLQL